MDYELKYLIIIKSSGLPLYSQSFNFQSDGTCNSFEGRINTKEGNDILLGGLFQAMVDFASETISDTLERLNLSFNSYTMSGIIEGELLFLGFFNTPSNKARDVDAILCDYMHDISTTFTNKYPKNLIDCDLIDIDAYSDFSIDLQKLGFYTNDEDCRNCLTKCTDCNKNCVPHLIYYNKSNN